MNHKGVVKSNRLAILSEISLTNFLKSFSPKRFFCDGIIFGSSGSIRQGWLMLFKSGSIL